jgi:hypothetical protein
MNDTRAKVPSPPHPHRRNEPLPSQSPKSPAEDPDAPARIAAIMKSPGHRLAEQDVEFLGSDAMRPAAAARVSWCPNPTTLSTPM